MEALGVEAAPGASQPLRKAASLWAILRGEPSSPWFQITLVPDHLGSRLRSCRRGGGLAMGTEECRFQGPIVRSLDSVPDSRLGLPTLGWRPQCPLPPPGEESKCFDTLQWGPQHHAPSWWPPLRLRVRPLAAGHVSAPRWSRRGLGERRVGLRGFPDPAPSGLPEDCPPPSPPRCTCGRRPPLSPAVGAPRLRLRMWLGSWRSEQRGCPGAGRGGGLSPGGECAPVPTPRFRHQHSGSSPGRSRSWGH